MKNKKSLIKTIILILAVFILFTFFQTIIKVNLLDSQVINPYICQMKAFEKCRQIRDIDLTDQEQMTSLMDSFRNCQLTFNSGALEMYAISDGEVLCSIGESALPDDILSLESQKPVSLSGLRYERYDFDNYSLIVSHTSMYDEDNSTQKFTFYNIIQALPMLLPVLLFILIPAKDYLKKKKRISIGFYVSLGYMLLTSLITVLVLMYVVKVDNNRAVTFSANQIVSACNESPDFGLSPENGLNEFFSDIVNNDTHYDCIYLKNSKIDSGVSLDEQIIIEYSGRDYTNRTIEVIAQLCLLTLGFILMYDRGYNLIDETIGNKSSDSSEMISIKGGKQKISVEAERFYIIMLLFGFAISLPHSINIIQLKRLAELNSVGNSEWLTSISTSLTAVATMVFAFFSTAILTKVAKSFLVYFRISLSIGLLSMAISAFASNVYLYAFAFILSYVSSGMSLVIPTVYSASLTDSDVVYARLKSGSQLGECIGIILGGILSANFSNEAVFGVSSVLFVPILALTFVMKETKRISSNGNSGNAFKVFKDSRAVLTWILLIVPYGMIDVFVGYTMPIDIVDFGYTAVIVSSLLMSKKLISATCKKLYFLVKKRISVRVGAIIYLLSGAALLTGYFFYRSIISMIIVVLLLSLLGCMGVQMLTNTLYESKTKDDYSKKELGALFDVGKNLGKTMAPICISLFGGVICIPIVTAVGVGIHSALSFFRKKKN